MYLEAGRDVTYSSDFDNLRRVCGARLSRKRP